MTTLTHWSGAVISSISTQTRGFARIHSTFWPSVVKPYKNPESSL